MTETVSAMEAGKIPVWIAKMQIIRAVLEPIFIEVPSCHLPSDPKSEYSKFLTGYKKIFS